MTTKVFRDPLYNYISIDLDKDLWLLELIDCREKHEHTSRCHVYGFHDFRRAFATVNAETLSGDALQKLMRHKSFPTTQRYINMAEHLNRSVETLHVPEVLRVGAG